MPRPARFDQDAILDAALRLAAERGPARVTIESVAGEMGGHVGSIYYRFPTKDHLLAQLWMRCARAGQAGILRELGRDDVGEAFERAVLHYPRWSREDPVSAQVLATHGREQFALAWPEELAADLATVNDDLAHTVETFTGRWYGDTGGVHLQAMRFALLDLPASAIRRYLLAGKPPPASLDHLVLAAARGAVDAATSSQQPLAQQ